MKTVNRIFFILMLLLMVTSCDNDLIEMPADNSVEITGDFEVLKSGTLIRQSGTNTMGMVQVVEDSSGKFFIRLSENFDTKFSTGTVTVYLSTSSSLRLEENESFQLIGIVNKPGQHFYELNDLPDTKFTHGIIWCGAARIPFGNALIE
ncbi:DM13 domain-containing protein [Pararhodonellum marinum]|uniref:DM13 domain-containing protein n=1 Tax=Pararhodonellum marinum TaxID=2755358 RepID=UPI00188FA049|nr:DM13 domain-containing protein [Pararhodonellum marinum]